MHLQREHVCRKNEFDEERKFVAFGELRAAPFARHFPPGVTQRFAAKFRRGDTAVESGEPCFAERLCQIRFLREKRGERPSAPDARAENRLEPLRRWLQI